MARQVYNLSKLLRRKNQTSLTQRTFSDCFQMSDIEEIRQESWEGEDDSEEIGRESEEDLLSTPESQEVHTPTDPDSFVNAALGRPSLTHSSSKQRGGGEQLTSHTYRTYLTN